jgi:methylmalonyl-CoA mutase
MVFFSFEKKWEVMRLVYSSDPKFAEMKDLNFDEFPESSFEDWKKLVQKELGEKSYDSLTWRNENGFDIQPYYTDSSHCYEISKPAHWDFYQKITGPSSTLINKKSLESLMGGSNALAIGSKVDSKESLKNMLLDVELKYIAIHFTHPDNPAALIDWIIEWCKEKGLDTKTLRGSCCVSGMAVIDLMKKSKEYFSLFKVLSVDAVEVHQKGALPVHELAVALAKGNEFLHVGMEAGITVDDTSAMLQFNFVTGTSYFAEIAKYRAFRVLWRTIVEQYKPAFACSTQCVIHASTSSFNQTTKDHYNNLLRATTQCMSAIIGGANSVEVIPSYEQDKSESDRSLRLSRNIQQLLIEESYLQQAGDVAAGSFYIEAMTNGLVDQAWSLFQEIEKLGGISKAANWLDEQLAFTLERRRNEIRTQQKIVVGVNKYQNKKEVLSAAPDSNSLTGGIENE